ncbi:MAG TPA: alanine racemase [Thermomicrobiales bacterium]|nr:alanine racemase [Thermomicrobiales bacterium]
MNETVGVGTWQGRPTYAVVDLDALATNITTLREGLSNDAAFMAVIKANAYGHGAVPIAETALAAGATSLAVATVDEGAVLRRAGIDAPVLVLGPVGEAERQRAVGLDFALAVSDIGFAAGVASDARMYLRKEPLPVHLKIDTGMRRFGVMPDDVVATARAILSHPELHLAGVFTHLACADVENSASAHEQVAIFDRCVAALREAGIDVPVHHVANSAATIRFPEFHRGMVRVGIAMYGLRPDISLPLPSGVKPVMTVHSRVARIIPLAPGDTVGYGGTWRAEVPAHGALIPIGYADGYQRALSSKGWMAIAGSRADVLGRVCMDQTIVRLPDAAPRESGQPVLIVGDGTPATLPAPTFDELGQAAGTIGYELVASLAARLPKLYVRGGEVVAVADLEGYRSLVTA